MPSLATPSAVLGQTFVLPKVEPAATAARPTSVASATIIGYGFMVGNIGLLIPNMQYTLA